MASSAVDGADALSGHPLFHSEDLEETRDRVGQIFCPHDLSIERRRQRLDARMFHASLGDVSLNRLAYGATVLVDPGRLETFFLIEMPLAGGGEVQCGSQIITMHPGLPSVVTPTLPTRMNLTESCDQLAVRIDRALLERHCMQHLGHTLSRPVEFELGMDFTNSRYDSWRHLIAYLVAEVDRDRGILSSPLARAQLEQLVVTTLLLSHPNNYSEELLRPAPSLAPAYVRRAEEFMEAHADQPVSIVEIAAHAGVSTRALFAAFRQFRGTSPMAHLKAIRLQRAHDELAAASSEHETVTRVAMRWGFTHLGNFTADYKRRFGESPSETLRRFK